MMGSTPGITPVTTTTPISEQSSIISPIRDQQLLTPNFSKWNFLSGNNNISPPTGLYEESPYQPNSRLSSTLLNPLAGIAENLLSTHPFAMQPSLFDPSASIPFNQARKDIYVLHEATGLKSFENGWEAALFILMAEKIEIGEFLRRIELEREKILKQPTRYDFMNSWKYFLMHSDPHWKKDEAKNEASSSHPINITRDQIGTGNEFTSDDVSSKSTTRTKRSSPDMVGLERASSSESNKIFAKGQSKNSSPERKLRGSAKMGSEDSSVDDEHGSTATTTFKSKAEMSNSKLAAGSPGSMVNSATETTQLQGKANQTRAKTGSNSQALDKKHANQSKALVEELHISLSRRGDLVEYKDVQRWVEPTPEKMMNLQTRVIEDWMRPNNLKQQDIVNATGLGASYICYLLKDPGNNNMSRRRRCEVYSVLADLFEKYDAGTITDAHFIAIKNARLNRRRNRRPAPGEYQKQSHDEEREPSNLSRSSIDSAAEAN